jgi:hypothetical protein
MSLPPDLEPAHRKASAADDTAPGRFGLPASDANLSSQHELAALTKSRGVAIGAAMIATPVSALRRRSPVRPR